MFLKLISVALSAFVFAAPAFCQEENNFPMERAMETYLQSHYAEAMSWLHVAAEMSDVRAQEALGLMYLFGWQIYGEEVPQDRGQARAWFYRAEALGSELARHMLKSMAVPVETNKPDAKIDARFTPR